jgi:hypothetical protein
MRYLLFLLLLLPARASELEIKARIEPSGPYHLGDSLRFVVEVTRDPKTTLDSDLAGPLSAALQSAGFEASVPPSSTLTGAQDVSLVPRVDVLASAEPRPRLTLSAPVTTFTTGVHRVPSITLRYRDTKNAPQTAQTPEMVVPVLSLLSTTSEPRGVKPPVPYPWAPPLWPLALILLLIALAFWTIRLRRPRVIPPPPPLPPDVEALGRIEALLAEAPPPAPKEFCDRLSDLLRHYLGRRFGLASMGDTSHELLASLTPLIPDDLDRLRAFLEECDLAKFARHRPENSQSLVESARALITRTRPRSDLP